jgi:hypothetical protein
VVRALQENAELINPSLPMDEYKGFLRVLLEHADVLAFSLSDLKETADFPPMEIEVTSTPIR